MFTELLKKLARGLDSAGIPYMVFGGQAVLLHGEFRVTRDIDITLGLEPGEAAPVLAMIAELGLEVLVSDAAAFCVRLSFCRHKTRQPGFALTLYSRFRGLSATPSVEL